MAKDSDVTNDRILASTLHEVRTPIQTIISTIELLSDTPLNKEQREYIRQIDFSANVLLQLANEILDFTKIRSGEFKLEYIPFDVISLTENVVDLISIDSFNRGLEIVTDIDYSLPAVVRGDPTRIQQILINLVKNAVKFTPKGYVLVKLSRQDNFLVFQVIDSGIGVAEDKREMIFADYYQVDASTARKYGGTGLGLSICKGLVTAMNGQIGIRDNPHGGSIFWFSIPLLASENEIEETPIKLNIPEKTKVLIVDDNSLAVQNLEKKLQALGIDRIETALSGKAALEKLTQAQDEGIPFTIAFIDMTMPVTDGWHLASEINENKTINNILLYLVVPEGQMGGEAKMKMLEWFNGYLYKPIKRKNLVEILNQAFTQPMDLEVMDGPSAKQEDSGMVVVKTEEFLNENKDDAFAQGYKILIAEDHPLNRKIMETFLTRFGAIVYLAEDGDEAIQSVIVHPDIDLIFMDIQMPVKNGIDATIELRRRDYNGVIIACTANNDSKDFEAYRQNGMNDILVKPFKRDTIKQMIEKWLIVLSIPEGKKLLSLTEVVNNAAELWNIPEFNTVTGGDYALAVSLLDEYITQTKKYLANIKSCLTENEIDYEQIRVAAHTLKGSSSTLSVITLAKYGEEMEDAAKKMDSVAIEAARTNFAIDFMKLREVIEDWEKVL